MTDAQRRGRELRREPITIDLPAPASADQLLTLKELGKARKTRPPLGELKPGQKVMVRRSANDMRRRPAEDRYIPAHVVKVGRVWATIAATEKVIEWRMRMDVQNEASPYSGSDSSFLTLEQYAWEETRTWALGVLGAMKIDILPGSPWRGREVELADLLTRATQAASTSPRASSSAAMNHG